MKPILILYATREGHTRKIAEHVAATVRARGLDAEVHACASLAETLDLARFEAAILAGSIHAGKHERELVRFVKQNLDALDRMPTAFLSVSLSETGAEDPARTPEERAKFAADVQRVLDTFCVETGWEPGRVKPVAGALLYTKYGILTRFIMKHIARSVGASTDTSHDHEFTDWVALDRFVDDVVASISAYKAPQIEPTEARLA